jgi:hypothetical protein
VIAAAIKDLKEQRLDFQFPAMSKDYAEYDPLRNLQREYSKHHSRLVEQITQDAADRNLKADKTIRSLIDLGQRIEITEDIYRRAKQRHERGNPPGKAGSLGDAINWEALLSAVPQADPFYIITDDNDYSSVLNKVKFNPFLAHEWSHAKSSSLTYYKTLSAFFRDKHPDIHFAPELEKTLLIRDLVNSGNFARTHSAIASLRRFDSFSPAQLNEIVSAAIANNQIAWIVDDQDVKEFLTGLISGQEDKIDPENLRVLQELLTGPENSEVVEF